MTTAILGSLSPEQVGSAEERRRARARIWAKAPKRSSGTEVVLLSVFGDESTDEKESRVFAVAGVVGWEPDWQAAELEWSLRTGGKPFGAAKCEHEREFDLYKDLTEVLVRSRLGAYGIALDLLAYKRYFPEQELDIGYYTCFMRVVGWLVNHNVERHGEPTEFTFHHRRKSDYNAGQLYDVLVNMPEWEENIFMKNTVSFDSAANPRIQMADLVAREAMKSLDNEISGLPPRESMLALCTPEGGTHIDWFREDWCRDLRAAEDRMNMSSELAAWLEKNKLANNVSNRIRYMAWLNASALRRK